MRRTLTCLAIAALSMPVVAQLTLVGPNGYATTAGNAGNTFPWNRATASMRIQFLYDSTTFTAQGVAGPVVITRLRYRPQAAATTVTWAGGSWPNVRIDMATSPVDYLAPSATFASNLGNDVTTVHNGPVVVQPGAGLGAGIPTNWYIDIPLATAFLYDPTTGSDLTIDIHLDGTGWTGTSRPADHVSGVAANPFCSRVYNTAGLTSPTGTVATNYGAVCEFTWQSAVGFATKSSYGTGCYNRPRMVYEQFPGISTSIDVVNTTQTLIYVPNGNGGNYVIVQAGPPYDPVTAAANGVNLATLPYTSAYGTTWDDASITRTLPATTFPAGFPFPAAGGGSTTVITVNSNGKIYLGSTTDATFATNGSNYASIAPFQGTTGAGLPVLAPYNCDIDPVVGGAIWYEDPSPNGGVRITWAGVPNWQNTAAGSPPAVICDLQMELLPSGTVTFAYGPSLGTGGSLNNDAIIGFSAGGGQPVTPQVDWSTLSGYASGDGSVPVTLDASARPVIGTSISMIVGGIPASSPFAAVLYGLTKFDPGISLASIGMPGCQQYGSQEAVVIGIVPGASFSTLFAIPNSTSFAGVRIVCQGAVYNPGSVPNALGAISSNGVELVLDVN